jgi:hypothetical protein
VASRLVPLVDPPIDRVPEFSCTLNFLSLMLRLDSTHGSGC